MADEMKNWAELHRFLQLWDRPAHLQGNEQMAIVPCQVAYRIGSRVRHVSTVAHVMVKTGEVILSPEDWLDAEDHYVSFKVQWQDFSVTDTDALRIDGNGPKLGSYRVEITPSISN